MADEELEREEGAPEEEGGGKKKKGKLKLIIIIVVAALLLGAGGFFGWRMFFAGDEPAPAKAPAAEEKAAAQPGAEPGAQSKAPAGTVVNLEPFIVNLADASGKRYLKLTLAVDTKEAALKKAIEDRMPMIRDSILLLLTSKSYKDISTVTGKIRLRNEILKIMNRALTGAGSVHAVYFTEFVVQ